MNSSEQNTNTQEIVWFYEKNGQRIGGLSEDKIIEQINTGVLSYGVSVWRSGFPEWIKIENTELRTYLETIVPPPLIGDHVNNTVVWVLAFAPIIGLLLQYFISGMAHSSSQYLTEKAVADGDYWYVTLFLNIGLCIWDAKRLKMSGTDTNKFKGWRWVVPVYLFQRAKALNHNKAYFIVWLICFALSLSSLE